MTMGIRHIFATGAIAAAIFTIAACGGSSSKLITGTFTLSAPESEFAVDSSGCHGLGGFSDIAPGAEVQLLGDGKVIGFAHLVDSSTTLGISAGGAQGCVYTFQLKATPGYKVYGLQMGRRGTTDYTWTELLAGPNLTLQ